jgi:hypothetical protein
MAAAAPRKASSLTRVGIRSHSFGSEGRPRTREAIEGGVAKGAHEDASGPGEGEGEGEGEGGRLDLELPGVFRRRGVARSKLVGVSDCWYMHVR